MTYYRAYISGKTWEGFDGETSFEFRTKPTIEEVMSHAGDFQAVEDIVLHRITTKSRIEALRKLV